MIYTPGALFLIQEVGDMTIRRLKLKSIKANFITDSTCRRSLDNTLQQNNNMKQPVYIKIDKSGDKVYYSDENMTVLHREDGPAIEWNDGFKEWWLNGKLHRETGPAIESANGSKSWYLNGKRHREDGPAIEWHDGYKEWYLNGKLHREDGPAVEYADGYKEWWLNGKSVTQEEHAKRTQKETVLTLDEIAEKFGVPVEKIRIKQ
jgi:hypothetical protein